MKLRNKIILIGGLLLFSFLIVRFVYSQHTAGIANEALEEIPSRWAARAVIYGNDGTYIRSIAIDTSGNLYSRQKGSTGKVLATDGQIKASAGVLYGFILSCDGVTAGDKIEIKNSLDNSGTALCTIVAQATDAVYPFTPVQGITYSTGIYFDETKSGGTFTISAIYD